MRAARSEPHPAREAMQSGAQHLDVDRLAEPDVDGFHQAADAILLRATARERERAASGGG